MCICMNICGRGRLGSHTFETARTLEFITLHLIRLSLATVRGPDNKLLMFEMLLRELLYNCDDLDTYLWLINQIKMLFNFNLNME